MRDLNEVDLVQNAAFGAALIWKFCVEYQKESLSRPPPMPITFLVLAVCLHTETLMEVVGTRPSSGLTLFAAKVGEVRENLLAIHTRALSLRDLSLQSIGMGARTRLLSVDYKSATVRANATQAPVVPERVVQNWNSAGRLGLWCANLTPAQIGTILKVDF